ncbi:MAG: ribonuclease III [Patescibacteria group bacterium]|jgi:ribonuclease-3
MDFNKISETLKVTVKDERLITTAFTHRSYLNEHPEYENPSNERLEFLGDAVLQLLSSQFLYEKYPNHPEGDLTNFRAAIVCTQSLAQEAKRLGFGEFLLLSHGEESTGGREREYILANTFEAILGALFIEEDMEFCKKFTEEELFYKVEEMVENESYKDAKSLFQEIAQEKMGITPAYKVLDSWGLDHEKVFKIGVFLEGEEYGTGEGRSKQKAEQEAAEKALDKLKAL